MTEEEVRARLVAYIKKVGLTKAAKEIGDSKPYLSQQANGTRIPSQNVLTFFKIKKIIYYE